MKKHWPFFPFTGLIVLVFLFSYLYVFLDKGVSAPQQAKPVLQLSSLPKLHYIGQENIPSSKWIKSILFNTRGSKLYTLNLENMSIDEFDRQSRKLCRKFLFIPHPAPGWDYERHKAMNSFEEKPVEACFSHDDKILWVSLHNAGGIVAIRLDSMIGCKEKSGFPTKRLSVFSAGSIETDTVSVPFIRTGKTPKVIARTSDSKRLMVSNWTAGTLSIISINDTMAPYAKKIKDVMVGALPRGMYVNNISGKTFVAVMGGNVLSVIDNKSWKAQKSIRVIQNPRHLLADSTGRLFVSFNASAQIACINPISGRTLFTAQTEAGPRTIALSEDQRYLFVTCYQASKIQVFKVYQNGFRLAYSIPCSGKPVGIDLYEEAGIIEAWVCTYTEDNLKIFTFRKS